MQSLGHMTWKVLENKLPVFGGGGLIVGSGDSTILGKIFVVGD